MEKWREMDKDFLIQEINASSSFTEASKRIGFDISNLNTKQISQVLSQLEYVQDVKDVRVDEIATSTEKQIEEFNDILKFLDIEESKYVLDKNTMQENLVNLNNIKIPISNQNSSQNSNLNFVYLSDIAKIDLNFIIAKIYNNNYFYNQNL